MSAHTSLAHSANAQRLDHLAKAQRAAGAYDLARMAELAATMERIRALLVPPTT